MDAAVSSRVVARNGIGQFIRECEQAASETVMDIAEQGAAASRAIAPERTGRLKGSILPFQVSRTQAVWGSNLKYALPQETGSVPHELPGNVSFFWLEQGRMWRPGSNMINHPGNPATHFLRDGWERVKPRMLEIARKHYPG